MIANRSIPQATVIPELAYSDVGEAIDWLCDVFGFSLRLRIANHRAQLHVGDGSVVLIERPQHVEVRQSILVRVEDADAHHARVQQRGARILRPPATYPYGERQYSVEDVGGHCWTFSQSVADIDPTEWGGTPGRL